MYSMQFKRSVAIAVTFTGNKALVARHFGISLGTIYQWEKEDPVYRNQVQDLNMSLERRNELIKSTIEDIKLDHFILTDLPDITAERNEIDDETQEFLKEVACP